MSYRKRAVSAALLAFLFLFTGLAPAHAALSYTQLAIQSADENFIRRVQGALIQDVIANKILATTPAASDVTIAAQQDRLGRLIAGDPHAWAIKFARLVAVQLISKTDLIDPAVTTDSDIFSAEGAIYNKLLPSL